MSPILTRVLAAARLLLAFAGLTSCSGDNQGLGVPPTTCSTHAVSAGESPAMEPGGDCIGCHSSGEGPHFVFAGTVMAALNDDTNCAGIQGATVRITGADGNQLDLSTNETGNFFADLRSGGIAFPYRAQVIVGGTSVAMKATRTASETNCASCHTAHGANGAPGRIIFAP
jgi:hypothetical protein